MDNSLLDAARAIGQETAALRRWFHQNPETSFGEYETAGKIRATLEQYGIPYETVGDTGTIGVIEGAADSPVVGLRADIDALEIAEKNETPYKSRNSGLMHACGHDAHTAALLAAARLLTARRAEIAGTVKLVFQPAEEIGRGAEAIIKSGLLDDVDAFFGIHVRSQLEVGKIALRSGGVMGGANSLSITVTGRSGHAGHPDQAVDSIVAGAEIVGALQHIISREIAPTEPAVISVCRFSAGTRDNIIANQARITGSVRIASEQARAQIAKAVKRVAAGVADAYRVEAEVECEYATPILINSPELYPVVAKAAGNILSPEAVVDLIPQLGTEDFSQYAAIAPIFFAFVGSGGAFPHHHECFDIDERALDISAALHVSFVFSYLSGERNAGV